MPSSVSILWRSVAKPVLRLQAVPTRRVDGHSIGVLYMAHIWSVFQISDGPPSGTDRPSFRLSHLSLVIYSVVEHSHIQYKKNSIRGHRPYNFGKAQRHKLVVIASRSGTNNVETNIDFILFVESYTTERYTKSCWRQDSLIQRSTDS